MTDEPLEGELLPPRKPGVSIPGAEALAALNNVVEAAREYLRLREEHTTRRANIDAYKVLETERIRAAENVLNNYFKQVFDERAKNFSDLLQRLDKAAHDGNDHMVTETLGAMVEIAQKSPLADLADLGQIRKALDDPDHVWEL
jgi:hypothetical protein